MLGDGFPEENNLENVYLYNFSFVMNSLMIILMVMSLVMLIKKKYKIVFAFNVILLVVFILSNWNMIFIFYIWIKNIL